MENGVLVKFVLKRAEKITYNYMIAYLGEREDARPEYIKYKDISALHVRVWSFYV